MTAEPNFLERSKTIARGIASGLSDQVLRVIQRSKMIVTRIVSRLGILLLPLLSVVVTVVLSMWVGAWLRAHSVDWADSYRGRGWDIPPYLSPTLTSEPIKLGDAVSAI